MTWSASPLAQGRGLKHARDYEPHEGDSVAPRAGARIETSRCPRASRRGCLVAPRAGARIETIELAWLPPSVYVAPRAGARIETSQEYAVAVTMKTVAPRAGARIETVPGSISSRRNRASPLAQGRELKRRPCHAGCRTAGSPLAQGRGLKPWLSVNGLKIELVAPRAKARIET